MMTAPRLPGTGAGGDRERGNEVTMSRPTAPRTRRRPIPWGLLGTLALVLAVEGALASRALDLSRPEGWEWWLSGQASRRQPRRDAVLVFGSSMVKQGLIPRVVGRPLGRPAYNLALCAGPAPASYFLLRRALDSGCRPAAILVEFHPGGLTAGHALYSAYWPHLLGFRELADLAWSARDPGFFAGAAVARALPSARDRDEIRAQVLAALRGESRSQRPYNVALRRNIRANRGAKVIPKNPQYRGEVAPHLRASLLATPWACTPVNAVYVGRFLALAESRGIPAFWLLPPFAPGAQADRERAGLDASYRQFARGWQARFPGLVVVDGLRTGYADSTFTDAMHLDWQGACSLSADVADVVGRHLARGTPGPRWVALPGYRERAVDVPLEDFARSVAIGGGGEARSRR